MASPPAVAAGASVCTRHRHPSGQGRAAAVGHSGGVRRQHQRRRHRQDAHGDRRGRETARPLPHAPYRHARLRRIADRPRARGPRPPHRQTGRRRAAAAGGLCRGVGRPRPRRRGPRRARGGGDGGDHGRRAAKSRSGQGPQHRGGRCGHRFWQWPLPACGATARTRGRRSGPRRHPAEHRQRP